MKYIFYFWPCETFSCSSLTFAPSSSSSLLLSSHNLSLHLLSSHIPSFRATFYVTALLNIHRNLHYSDTESRYKWVWVKHRKRMSKTLWLNIFFLFFFSSLQYGKVALGEPAQKHIQCAPAPRWKDERGQHKALFTDSLYTITFIFHFLAKYYQFLTRLWTSAAFY